MIKDVSTENPDVMVMELVVPSDKQGNKSFNGRDFEEATGSKRDFVQDNRSGPGEMSHATSIIRSASLKMN